MKTTGEEKHYQKLNKRLSQELNKERLMFSQLLNQNIDLDNQIKSLQKKLDELTKAYDLLRGLSELKLSSEEIRKMIQTEEKVKQVISTLDMGLFKY